ncbi:uncharacterized protein NPIL_156891 [Nephila pilipes]|uniref:Uncharacterized protein n=1 Tax=Nephila pilipes TaxID=299642 RepID=A0A8X6NS07_NEPPI|nr:uncharacterized protein NPIL_156891 [Nephila pilipes]
MLKNVIEDFSEGLWGWIGNRSSKECLMKNVRCARACEAPAPIYPPEAECTRTPSLIGGPSSRRPSKTEVSPRMAMANDDRSKALRCPATHQRGWATLSRLPASPTSATHHQHP